MDKLKPIAWLYGFEGQPLERFLPTFERLTPLQPGWTETPLYDPATLLAVIGKALEAAAEISTSFLVGDPANGVPLRSPSPRQIAKAISALAPATILAGLTEAQADGGGV